MDGSNNKRRLEEEESAAAAGGGNNSKRQATTTTTTATAATTEEEECPYLDTIDRSVLDFDFEPACSVSMQVGPHIYGCLVCGKFFRGRGPATPAYTHSVEDSHFVFVHLAKGTFHCLPDDYEIRDPSLSDIAAALQPAFTPRQIAGLDQNPDLCRDLFGRRYLPGFVGLNNLNKTDCLNAVVQALAHVPPLRDYFLLGNERQQMNGNSSSNKNSSSKSAVASASSSSQRMAQQVARAFGELVRKIWSDRRFKSHVDPHILVQAVSVASKKKFQVGKQAEAGELMAWLLHQLHVGTGGSLKKKADGSSIVHKVFQGRVSVTTRQVKTKSIATDNNPDEEDDRAGSDAELDEEDVAMKDACAEEEGVEIEETTTDSHFLQLTLDIPEKPLFRDEDGGLVIPQEPFVNVLKKFDGVTFCDAVSRSGVAQRKRYQLTKLPDYLILHLSRFKNNKYSREKNPTIVAFPVKNLDLSDYVHHDRGNNKPPSEEDIRKMSIKELKRLLRKYGRSDVGESVVEKDELVTATVDFVTRSLPDLLSDKYDLVANITHESPGDVGREGTHDPLQVGSYKCHVQHRGTKQWYEMQDLHVQEVMPQQIGLSESYVLIFERKSAQQK